MKSISLTARSTVDVFAAAIFIALYSAGRYGANLEKYDIHLWNDLFWSAGSALASIRCFFVIRKVESQSRSAWLLFGLAHLAFFAGMLIWSFYEIGLGQLSPFPSLADLLFSAVAILFIAGIFYARIKDEYLGLMRFTASNLAIIFSALLLIVPIWLLDALSQTQADWSYMVVALSWAVGYSAAFIYSCVALWTSEWGSKRLVFALIVAALGTHALVAVIYTEALLRNAYEVGSWFDVLWLIAFALFWWAAGERGRMSQRMPDQEPPGNIPSGNDIERIGIADSLLASGAVAGTFLVMASSTATSVQLDIILMTLGITLPMAIAWRGWEFYRVSQNILAQREALVIHLRELSAAAKASGQAKSDFLAAMSHEIRTPLTGVLGMTDLLAAANLPSQERGYVEAIRASGRHLLIVINDILDFSRIETGKLELEHIDFSLPDLLERLRSVVHPQLIERRLELRFELSEHSPPILKGDPTRLKQVLLNLVGNAVKFTEKGSVTVSVAHQKADDHYRFRFEVRDTGIGIAPEKQAELFTAFTQVDRSTARRFGGSGLGLAISKRLVDAMGGEIGMNSLPGIGSIFWFEVPLELGDPLSLMKAANIQFAQAQPRRILVAEDVEINRTILRDVLTRQGHHLVFAENGAEAVALADREQFDLVLMDVQMPVMDGLEATRRIRKLDEPVCNIPILALTANVMAQEQERYLSAGMNECLMKPIDWQQLQSAISRYGGNGQAITPTENLRQEKDQKAPLVDPQRLEPFRAVMSEEELGSWLLRGIEDAERSHAELATLPRGSGELARKAHSLKGTSGTFGLMRISQIAAEIETKTGDEHEMASLVTELRGAVAATRIELRRRSLIEQ